MNHKLFKIAGVVMPAIFLFCLSFIPIKYGVIRGILYSSDSAEIRISYTGKDGDYHNFTKIKDNKLDLKFSLPEPLLCTLTNNINQQMKIFLGENLPLSISGNIKQFYDLTISNAKLDSLYKNIKDSLGKINIHFRKIVQNENLNIRDTTTNAFHNYKIKKEKTILNFIQKNKYSCVAALVILDNYVTYPNRIMVEKLYQLLSPIIQNSYYGMRIKTFLDASHIISPGKRAPDFSLKDNNGKTIQLKNFKGKYVFLDFWASWCAPCRKKHPEIVDLHNRNQNKIVFVSISFDSDHSSWTKAIELDKLTWTQLNDPQNFNGQVSEIYGIKSLPFNCLIDTNGFIIEKQISFSYLDNFIKKNL